MTHEWIQLLEAFGSRQEQAVLATLVRVEGSSYRGPDARMLVFRSGRMAGALSGGCVEQEIRRQSEEVFQSGCSKMMQYDGRYRLGCEGQLYILLEPFDPGAQLERMKRLIANRESFSLLAQYRPILASDPNFGTFFRHGNSRISLTRNLVWKESFEHCHSRFPPRFRLCIFGAEHDAVALAEAARYLGWEVVVVNPPEVPLDDSLFPEGVQTWHPEPGATIALDQETAVVLMTHNYARDLHWLGRLQQQRPAYVGLLGPVARREKLIYELLERYPELDPDFLDLVHGPAGLDLGAINAREIALSILSEILARVRDKQVIPLREKTGSIHE